MTEVFDLNSWNVAPIVLIATDDGASIAVIGTDCC